jgi:hypothetical protein
MARDSSETLFQSSETLFQSSETSFQGSGTLFQSSGTSFQSSETLFQGSGTLFQSSETSMRNSGRCGRDSEKYLAAWRDFLQGKHPVTHVQSVIRTDGHIVIKLRCEYYRRVLPMLAKPLTPG